MDVLRNARSDQHLAFADAALQSRDARPVKANGKSQPDYLSTAGLAVLRRVFLRGASEARTPLIPVNIELLWVEVASAPFEQFCVTFVLGSAIASRNSP